MKYLALIFLLTIFSCKKEVSETTAVESEQPAIPFDTTAIDSFSVGSTSVNVARKIEMSSKKYQDSLQAVKKAAETEQKIRDDAKKIDAEAEKAVEKEKKMQKKTEPELQKPVENPTDQK